MTTGSVWSTATCIPPRIRYVAYKRFETRGQEDLFRRFGNLQNLVGMDAAEHLPDAAGPVDFDAVHQLGLAQSEVNARVAGGSIADARGHLVVLISDADARADAVAIAAGSVELEHQPGVAIGS